MKLSLLICHMPDKPDRVKSYNLLLDELERQDPDYQVQVLADWSRLGKSVGAKRNSLLQDAEGEYIAFIDDDDRISPEYISLLMEGINKGADCCSLRGIITENGLNPLIFEHSIKYNEYRTNNAVRDPATQVTYERYPNHLNCIKADIAKRFAFPEKNHGEDTDWATQIFKSGLLKTEHWIEPILYNYDWKQK